MRWLMKISPSVGIGFLFVVCGLFALTLPTPAVRNFSVIVSFAVALWALVAWYVRRRAKRGKMPPDAQR